MTEFDVLGPIREPSGGAEPADFDEFWRETLQNECDRPLSATYALTPTPFEHLLTYDVAFCGFGGDLVRGWLTLPAGNAATGHTCVVEYLGYGGGRGQPADWLLWPSAGFAHLVIDVRGQSSGGRQGVTPDPHASPHPHEPGFVSQGILDRNRYYYRRVYVDAVRAVEAARTAPGVDPRRVAVTGISQGGGIALAVGGLVKDLLLVMSSVPFLCDFRRAVYLTNENPYAEIRRYLATHPGLVETTFRTLDYFDGVNFAKRATAPAVFSTALLDPVCPPATVQAAIQAYASDKTVDVWPFNGHEGGGVQQQVMNIGRLQRILAAPPS